MSETIIYFDNNATTGTAPEVLEAMLPYLKGEYGNPSSMHSFGGRTGTAVAKAREQVAALLGAVPLMFGFGTGAELRQPLGIAVVGGLLVSQALTLFTTPVIYLALERLFHRRQAAHAAAPSAS